MNAELGTSSSERFATSVRRRSLGGLLSAGILASCLVFTIPAAEAAPNPNPTWRVDDPILFRTRAEPFDHFAVKDPTIVFTGGRYHMFYTGANASGGWQMLYSSATTLEGFRTAPHIFLTRIGESYFAAPEVFFFEPHGLWYLVYQDGTFGAAYATTTNIADPNSWSGPKSFGVSGNLGWDYYVICDDVSCYMYNSPSDGSRRIFIRRTSVNNFPNGRDDVVAQPLRDSNRPEARADFDQMAAAFRALYGPLVRKEARYHFDIDEAIDETRAALQLSRNDSDTFRMISRFIDRFHDAHISYSPSVLSDSARQVGVPLLVTPVESKFLVYANELSFSGGDLFPMLVKANHLATLFGETTAGAGGNVEEVLTTSFSQGTLRLTRSIFAPMTDANQIPFGTVVEDLGISPDVAHPLTVSDFRAGHVGYVKAFSEVAAGLVH
jgi:hypothetical protein